MAITPEEAKEKYTKLVLEKFHLCEKSIDKLLTDNYHTLVKKGSMNMTESMIRSGANLGSYNFDQQWSDPVIQAILEKFKNWEVSHSEKKQMFTFCLKEAERTHVTEKNIYQFLDLDEELGKDDDDVDKDPYEDDIPF